MKKVLKTAALVLSAASVALGTAPAVTSADNPVVQTSYTSDPAPMVYDGVFYMYTGHDADGADNYIMPDWKCFSSTDMQNWTDHGTILPESTFKWAGENSAWAAQCIERNGKFYMYVTVVPANGGGRAIGVAVADSPTGPFTDPIGKPLCGPDWAFIDPTVFIDDDGQAYLYFGNPNPYYVKLNEDMISYSGSITKVNMTPEGFGTRSDGENRMYVEGPWFYKRGGLYYLLYAANGIPENIAYSTAPTPTGPWTYRGVIMPSEGRSFTNHCGIVDYEGRSYFAYHNGALPGGNGFQRSVCIEEFTYNADGSIPTIKMSKSGPEQLHALDPFVRTEAECFCWEEGIETETCSEGGINIANIENGDYVKVKGVDFSEGADTFTASVSSAEKGGSIELRIDSPSGDIIGTCEVPSTGGWQKWQEVSCPVEVSGEHDLYLRFTGGSGFLFNVDWWRFGGAGQAPDNGSLYHSTFERSLESWSGRAGAKVTVSDEASAAGEKSAKVTDRTSAWQGIVRKLGRDFKAGMSYSFSAKAMCAGEDTVFHLTLQYSDGEDVLYKKIDTVSAKKGQWVQLCGNDFMLPEGASDMYVYVETDSGTADFYADEMIAASADIDLIDPEFINAVPGDTDRNGRIDGFDLVIARKGLVRGFKDIYAEKAADADRSGSVQINDLVLIQKYLLGDIKVFPEK